MLGPTKTRFVLHELVSQISLFQNYEKFIFTYVKSRETEGYSKTRMKLKLFEGKLDFWSSFENRSLENYLKIGVLGIKFKNWNFGNWKLSSAIRKLEFQKLRTKIGNWNFEELFKDRILKINK